MGNALNFFQEL